MKVGFIGAGRVGCSMGKYLSLHGVQVSGYFSRNEESAAWAAQFTQSVHYRDMKECVQESDILCLTVPDDAIEEVWREVRSYKLSDKTICHFSGLLTSKVFVNLRLKGAYGASIHPMFAFNDKEHAFEELEGVGFTVEGDANAVQVLRGMLEQTGNPVMQMEPEQKAKYHAAASMLSNHVAAVLACGYELLEAAGFDEAQARTFSKALVMGNVSHIVADGAVSALTGPIERGDVGTVQKHLQVLDKEQEEMYRFLGERLIRLAEKKHPEKDYTLMRKLLK